MPLKRANFYFSKEKTNKLYSEMFIFVLTIYRLNDDDVNYLCYACIHYSVMPDMWMSHPVTN